MGTRNLTKVIDKDGITRVGQYGQWDGYPDYMGTRILDFISEYKMLDKIEKSLAKGRFITDEEAEAFSKPFVNEDGWMTMDNGNDFSAMYPSLTRDTGCDILKVLVYSTGEVPLVDQSDFENDELYCEGVYTIDFSTRTYTTKWNGYEVSFGLDTLPNAEEYLNSFKSDLVGA